jgi:hypothetical protein
MTCDFPAAHSMDTHWFAVDAEGKVALFVSHEAGCVPEEWHGGQDGGDTLVYGLRAAGRLVLTEEDLAATPNAFYRDPSGRYTDQEGPNNMAERYDVLMELSHERVRDLLPRARPIACPPLHLVLVSGPIPVTLLEQMLERGLVRRAWSWFELPPSAYGLYAFDHDDRWENWISGPYRRMQAPARPVLLAELSPAQQALAVPLEKVSFARDEQVQPAALVSCRSWQSEWVDLEGQRHHFDD